MCFVFLCFLRVQTSATTAMTTTKVTSNTATPVPTDEAMTTTLLDVGGRGGGGEGEGEEGEGEGEGGEEGEEGEVFGRVGEGGEGEDDMVWQFSAVIRSLGSTG